MRHKPSKVAHKAQIVTGTLYGRTNHKNNRGYHMQFESADALATKTPSHALSAAWGMCEVCAARCTHGKRPMTIRQAGALAELHGMKLLDILAV